MAVVSSLTRTSKKGVFIGLALICMIVEGQIGVVNLIVTSI